MTRRGASLREHIIDTAKLAFLESGYERTSMDAVAARAETSKRSLYAHFPTKDALFLAVVERVRDLFRGSLLAPRHYAEEPAEAVARYCARFLQLLGYAPILQTCRLGITEAGRLPGAAAELHQVFFETAAGQLAVHLTQAYGVDAAQAERLATQLLGATIYPALVRALFGLTALRGEPHDEGGLEADVDVTAIRRAISPLLPAAGVAVSPRRAAADRS